jgi:hypothetical protein
VWWQWADAGEDGTASQGGPGLGGCGIWQSVSAQSIDGGHTNASEVPADGVTPIVLTATGSGPDYAALAYHWSVLSSTGDGVKLGAETGNGTTTSTQTLTCNPSTVTGGAVIQLTVTDSIVDAASTCPTTLSTVTVPVTCDGVAVNPCSDAGPNHDKCGAGAMAICTNLQTDINHCGTCGNLCPTGEVCSNGTCACQQGSTALQCQCNQFVASNEVGNTPANTCSPTELVAYMVDANTTTPGSCLDCLLNAGQCLDNSSLGLSGNDCEDPFTGPGAGETTEECAAVLGCDLGVTPPAVPAPVTPTGDGPVEGYCGATALQACTGAGACASQIVAGFPPNVGPNANDIVLKEFASGRAGAIVLCAQISCPQCLAGSTL